MTDTESAQSAAGAGLRPAFAAARAHLALIVILFALAGAGWWWTIRQMRGMDTGPWTDLGTFGWFLGVWIVMMAAMMFPSVAPTVALYARMSRKSRLAPLLFVAGYLTTWAGAGTLAFLIGVVVSGTAPDLAWEHAGRPLTGATLILAAVYEMTPLKNVCLAKCRSPLGLLLGSWRGGWSGALRMGARNGAWCVGCCWALMASLFALGRHEPDLDGHRRRAHRGRETPSVAPTSDLRHGDRAPCPGCTCTRRTGGNSRPHHSGAPPHVSGIAVW